MWAVEEKRKQTLTENLENWITEKSFWNLSWEILKMEQSKAIYVRDNSNQKFKIGVNW